MAACVIFVGSASRDQHLRRILLELVPFGNPTSTSPPSLRRLTVAQVRDNISLPLSPLRRPPSLPVSLCSGVSLRSGVSLPPCLSPLRRPSPCLSPLGPPCSLPVSLCSGVSLPPCLSPLRRLSPCLSPLGPPSSLPVSLCSGVSLPISLRSGLPPSLPVSLRSSLLPLSLSLSAPAPIFKSHPRGRGPSSPAPWILIEAPGCFPILVEGLPRCGSFPQRRPFSSGSEHLQSPPSRAVLQVRRNLPRHRRDSHEKLLRAEERDWSADDRWGGKARLSPCLSPFWPPPSLPVSLRSGILPLSLSLSAPASSLSPSTDASSPLSRLPFSTRPPPSLALPAPPPAALLPVSPCLSVSLFPGSGRHPLFVYVGQPQYLSISINLVYLGILMFFRLQVFVCLSQFPVNYLGFIIIPQMID